MPLTTPEFFVNQAGHRVILTERVPHQPGEMHYFSPDVGRLRPMMSPNVRDLTVNGGSKWRFTFIDPAINDECKVTRSNEDHLSVNGIGMTRVEIGEPLLMETMFEDTRYLATCRFVLLHGSVDVTGRDVTVVRGANGGSVEVLLNNAPVSVREQHRDPESGSLHLVLNNSPSSTLYLPSQWATLNDLDRVPALDERWITPKSSHLVNLARLPVPPLTWDLIEK